MSPHTTASWLLLAALCGCGSPPPAQVRAAPSTRAPTAAAPVVSGQRLHFDSVDMYKNEVAEHIMRFNTAHTFSGRLPPMLPAVVVLSIMVDKDGKVTKASVQRSRDNDASKVALESVGRSGLLPRPLNLVPSHHKGLTFSETFLFNDQYQFQLRTLAGVQ